MEVTYVLTFEDLVHAAYVYAARKKQSLTINMAGGVILVCVSLQAVYSTALYSDGGDAAVTPIMACLFILWIGGQMAWSNSPFNIRHKIRRQMARVPTLTMQHTITLTPEYLCVKADYLDLRRKWEAVEDVFVDNKYLFITSGGTAYIIARRHFSEDADAERFLSLAITYWKSAKRPPVQDESVWPPAPHVPN